MIHSRQPIYKKMKFNVIVALFVFMIFVGTLFYHRVEKLSPVDSFYFSVVTLTTVGYGDISPQTNTGKIFTVFYIIIGIGVIMAFINTFAEYVVEKRTHKKINRANDKKKLDK